MSSGGVDITDITDADIAAVIDLWKRSGLLRPWNDPDKDIAFARASANATILVGRRAGKPIAAVMVGHDGHRGGVYYVSTDPDCRGEGLGRTIMQAAEAWLRARGVWKLNLIVRGSNAQVRSFYEAIGYKTTDNVQLERWLDGRPPVQTF